QTVIDATACTARRAVDPPAPRTATMLGGIQMRLASEAVRDSAPSNPTQPRANLGDDGRSRPRTDEPLDGEAGEYQPGTEEATLERPFHVEQRHLSPFPASSIWEGVFKTISGLPW